MMTAAAFPNSFSVPLTLLLALGPLPVLTKGLQEPWVRSVGYVAPGARRWGPASSESSISARR